jgi:hypothetical protein
MNLDLGGRCGTLAPRGNGGVADGHAVQTGGGGRRAGRARGWLTLFPPPSATDGHLQPIDRQLPPAARFRGWPAADGRRKLCGFRTAATTLLQESAAAGAAGHNYSFNADRSLLAEQGYR